METIVISDTSCLVVLDKIGQLHLLQACYPRVVITETIAQEFGKELPAWIEIHNPSRDSLRRLLEETLDAGESSALALAVEFTGSKVILDDLRARKVASSLGLNFMGTLGLIAEAKQKGAIPAARPIISAIEKTDFRLQPSLVEAVLRTLGEQL